METENFLTIAFSNGNINMKAIITARIIILILILIHKNEHKHEHKMNIQTDL